MLVIGIEFWHDDVENRHPSDSSMADPWRNKNCRMGTDGNLFAVEFHRGIGFAIEDEIGFRLIAMIVQLRVRRDFGEMNRAGRVVVLRKGSLGGATRTGDAGNVSEVDDLPSLCLAHVNSTSDEEGSVLERFRGRGA